MAVTGRADGERAQRKRKRSGDDGDTVVSCDAKLLKDLEKIYKTGCNLKLLSTVVDKLQPFVREDMRACLKIVQSMK